MKKIAALVLSASGLAWAGQALESGAHRILGIDRLLTEAKVHNGKAVVVSAIAVIEFENMSLCAKPPQKSRSTCVWLDIDEGPYDTSSDYERYKAALAHWSQFNGKKVIVHGTFTSGSSGHFGLWPGAIGHVTNVSKQ